MDNPRLPPFWGSGRTWQLQAACAGTDPQLFYAPEVEGGGAAPGWRERQRAAKAICAQCPVLAVCRVVVDRLEADEPRYYWAGIWAGETPPERQRRRRAQPPSGQEKGLEEATAIRVGRSP